MKIPAREIQDGDVFRYRLPWVRESSPYRYSAWCEAVSDAFYWDETYTVITADGETESFTRDDMVEIRTEA